MEINMDDYDISAIRDDLEDYYGTAMISVSPFATADLINLDSKSDYEIFCMAISMGIDLNHYYLGKRY